jgi:glycerol kinase
MISANCLKILLLCPQIEHQYPQIGQDEIEPEELWTKVVSVLREAVRGKHCNSYQVPCLTLFRTKETFVLKKRFATKKTVRGHIHSFHSPL